MAATSIEAGDARMRPLGGGGAAPSERKPVRPFLPIKRPVKIRDHMYPSSRPHLRILSGGTNNHNWLRPPSRLSYSLSRCPPSINIHIARRTAVGKLPSPSCDAKRRMGGFVAPFHPGSVNCSAQLSFLPPMAFAEISLPTSRNPSARAAAPVGASVV